MNSNLEKIFMNWILKHPEYFKNVLPLFFENTDIQFVYTCIRAEYLISKDKIIPSQKEIINLVKLNDQDNKITIDLIKTILKINFDEFRDEFIIPRFKGQLLYNSTKYALSKSIDLITDAKITDFDNVHDITEKIKSTIVDHTSIQLEKESLGLDFDNELDHDQEDNLNKIGTGYKTLDTILQGGFDRKTLSILMGGPGSGKCSIGQTLITIRNKITNSVENVTLEEFYNMFKII